MERLEHTVAVVTDGSAVLGLGNIGPKAALPVMEGKAMLFKEFGGVDAFPICLATKDTEEIIRIVIALAPTFANMGAKALFVLGFGIILSMYGGGFATVPAYLADIFGTQFVGAIHGRLLTAWSTAGIVGPVVVNYIREFEIAAGVPRDHVYDVTMYVLAGMLVGGFVCNFLIKPLADKWFMKPEEVAALQAKTAGAAATTLGGSFGIGRGGLDGGAVLFWALVSIPIAWGAWITLKNAIVIFQ
jgi:hypothetical protein